MTLNLDHVTGIRDAMRFPKLIVSPRPTVKSINRFSDYRAPSHPTFRSSHPKSSFHACLPEPKSRTGRADMTVIESRSENDPSRTFVSRLFTLGGRQIGAA